MQRAQRRQRTSRQRLANTKTKPRLTQTALRSFLKGNGCLPGEAALKNVERLWQQHVAARNKTNQFIQAVLESATTTDAS